MALDLLNIKLKNDDLIDPNLMEKFANDKKNSLGHLRDLFFSFTNLPYHAGTVFNCGFSGFRIIG